MKGLQLFYYFNLP